MTLAPTPSVGHAHNRSRLPTYTTLMRALAMLDAAAKPHAALETAMSTGPAFAATPFHSSGAPGMPLHEYAHYVASNTGYKAEGLAMGIALMARYAIASGRGVTPLSMHRLLGTCIQVGMKASCDFFVKNVHVAPIAGMTLEELNVLEAYLLDVLEFRAMPTSAEVLDLPRALAALAESPVLPTLAQVHGIIVHFVSAMAPLPPPPYSPPVAVMATQRRRASGEEVAAVAEVSPMSLCGRGGDERDESPPLAWPMMALTPTATGGGEDASNARSAADWPAASDHEANTSASTNNGSVTGVSVKSVYDAR